MIRHSWWVECGVPWDDNVRIFGVYNTTFSNLTRSVVTSILALATFTTTLRRLSYRSCSIAGRFCRNRRIVSLEGFAAGSSGSWSTSSTTAFSSSAAG